MYCLQADDEAEKADNTARLMSPEPSNTPRTATVAVAPEWFSTPLASMHMCAASHTTMTAGEGSGVEEEEEVEEGGEEGRRRLETASASWCVMRSCTCQGERGATSQGSGQGTICRCGRHIPNRYGAKWRKLVQFQRKDKAPDQNLGVASRQMCTWKGPYHGH